MLRGQGGNDFLLGQGGIDTAVFSGNRADYLVTRVGDSVQVSDLRPGASDGTDELMQVEYMEFADGTFATTAPPGDVLWRNSEGAVAVGGHALEPVANTWEIAGAGDFDGDGDSDVVWRHEDGDVVTWNMEGSELVAVNQDFANVVTTFEIVATGDFDADGDDDILWRDDNGDVVTWEMQDGAVAASHSIESASNSYQIEGGDLDDDGDDDILWRHEDGDLVSWEMEDGAYAANHDLGHMTQAAQMAGIGDFDGDGDGHILWRNPVGAVFTWEMEAGVHTDTHSLPVDTGQLERRRDPRLRQRRRCRHPVASRGRPGGELDHAERPTRRNHRSRRRRDRMADFRRWRIRPGLIAPTRPINRAHRRVEQFAHPRCCVFRQRLLRQRRSAARARSACAAIMSYARMVAPRARERTGRISKASRR